MVALENSTSESFVQRNFPDAELHTIANYDEGIQILVRNYMSSVENAGLTARLYKKWFEDNSWIASLP